MIAMREREVNVYLPHKFDCPYAILNMYSQDYFHIFPKPYNLTYCITFIAIATYRDH